MTPQAVQHTAILLSELRLRANGQTTALDELPTNCRPTSLTDAYIIQDAARAILAEKGLGKPIGWKIGCTTPVMQEYLNIPHPCAGTLYQKTVFNNYVKLRAADYFQLGLECEIAVKLANDMRAPTSPYNRETVVSAVAAVMTSVEIVEHRFQDFTKVNTASLVADDFFSVGCVLGPSHSPEQISDLASLYGGFSIDGKAPEQQGLGSAILEHPLNALAWLANHCLAYGNYLKAGEIITLGSVVKTIYPTAGMQIEARFDKLAPVRLEIQ